MSDVTRAEVCVVACADAWRGDGEKLASPFGVIPAIGARLAKATFSPDLMLSDGDAFLVAGIWPAGAPAPGPVEGWLPFRAVFDLVWAGRRHAMMIPAQIDRYGNVNISAIGPDFGRPARALLGMRGAPGNTVNHPVSYWVPRHLPRVFPLAVDVVCGAGYDRGVPVHLPRVVTNLGVLDFDGPEHSMRLVSVHPDVTVDDVVSATGFPLAMDDVTVTRLPTAEELRLIRSVIDPDGLRQGEVPDA